MRLSHFTSRWWRCTVLFLLILIATGCGSGGGDTSDATIRVVIDKSDPERLLRYYFGGYVSPRPADPYAAGILAKRGRNIYLNLDSLEGHFAGARDNLQDTNTNNRIDWGELERFIHATYYRARSVPPTFDSLRVETAFDPAGGDWMSVDVHGAMTSARRRIYLRRSALRSALQQAHENNRNLLYPTGAVFIGEHYVDGQKAETTVMRKRTDGFWDFFVYGRNDSLAVATATPPRELKAPVQCVGCHFGSKLFEPERSFPAAVRPGPHGPRAIYVGDNQRDIEVVKYFDEHRRRSDEVLGIYGTLFVSQLRALQRQGTISPADAALLDLLEL